MTFLELCIRTHREAGITGAGPVSVLSNTGQLLKIVGWVEQAWVDIQQMRPNWNFMWKEFTFDTTDTQRDYLASAVSISDMKLWDVNSFLIYKTATGVSDQTELLHDTYKVWRKKYRLLMENRDDSRPQSFTILPDKKVRFEPAPDDIYTVEGDYKRSTQIFSADADEPTNLDVDFHMIIVWQALKYYGLYEDAPEVLDEAETSFDNLLLRLENEELPTMDEESEALA